MKKMIIIFIVCIFLFSCAQGKELTILHQGKPVIVEIQPYGFFSLDEQNPQVKYRVSPGNMIWSILCFETIVVPVILCGWYLWEPVSLKNNNEIPGAKP